MGSRGPRNSARARTKRSNNAHEASEPVCVQSRSTDGHEDFDDDEDRSRTPSERAAAATTVVSSRSADESRLIDDAAPVTTLQRRRGHA